MYEPAIIELFKRVATSALSDALDTLSRKRRILDHKVRLLNGSRMVGPAVTLMTAPTAERAQHTAGIGLIDTAAPGSVVVAGLEDETSAALWGATELAAAIQRGLAGFVGDGAIRSVSQAHGHAFGVFATNVTPAGGFGRLKTMAANVPIECGGIEVSPGDLIVGDEDGVIAVPKALVPDLAALLERYEQRQFNLLAAVKEHGSLGAAIKLHWNVPQ